MPSAPEQSAEFLSAKQTEDLLNLHRRTIMRKSRGDPNLLPETNSDGSLKYPLRWRLSKLQTYLRRNPVAPVRRINRGVLRVAMVSVLIAFTIAICTTGGYCMLKDIYLGPRDGHELMHHFR